MKHLLVELGSVSKTAFIGNKAGSIQALLKEKLKVPGTFVVLPVAHNQFKASPDKTIKKLKAAIEASIDLNKHFAVRSSANLEDKADYSFAGQFKTILNVQGCGKIMDAIKEVWNSADLYTKSAYTRAINRGNERISMSVIIQEMVEPLWSGVAFSINPVTGRSEVVVEAVKGIGDSLVQYGKTPYRWVFSQGNWENIKEGDHPGLNMLNELVNDIKRLRKKRNYEIDVEWAFNGNEIQYLQFRSVTVSRFPTVFSNHLSREFLPGLIKPLVWSVNIPLVNGAWIRLIQKIVGPAHIKPEQLSQAFFYRAYFNMGTMGALLEMMGLPKNSLETLMGRKDLSGKSSFKPTPKTFLLLPRMIWFILSNLNIAKKFERTINRFRSEVINLEHLFENQFDIVQFKSYYQELFKLCSELAYYNIVIPLLMHITSGIFIKKLKIRLI